MKFLKIFKTKKSLILIVILSFSFIVFLQTESLRKVYRFSKNLSLEYLPLYSQNYLTSSIKDAQRNSSRETFENLNEHLNPEKLNLSLKKISDEILQSSDGLDYDLIKYRANFLNLVKRAPETGPSYIDFYKDQILIVQENGLFFSAPRLSVKSGEMEIPVIQIKTNITNFTNYVDFFNAGQFGIKDILIDNNFLYVSYIRELQPNCFNTSILRAEINEKINFKIFYSPKNCINRNKSDEFNAHQSGGRIVKFKNNKLLFSLGEYRNRGNAQKLDNDFGKIISIDIDSGNSEIISIGHRNPQGLYFSPQYEDIWSSEHGPTGGDEVNLNPLLGKEILNFGWPNASYGAHYGAGYYDVTEKGYTLVENREKKQYKHSPLHKSHIQYGYEEPLIYFNPSVGVSQIIEVKNTFSNAKNTHRTFMLGTMGYSVSKFIPSLSMLSISVDDNYKLLSQDQIIMNERMRDLIFAETDNTIFFSGDSNGTIGLIRPTKNNIQR